MTAEGPMPDDKLPDAPFWRTKKMSAMTPAEWESLCDGCGRCCLNKLTDVDTNETVYTDVGCKLLDGQSCRCTDYPNRQAKVRDCVRLTPRNIRRLTWLPPTCGYRLVAEGRDLAWWHPLKSGSAQTVHDAGISVRGKVAASEVDVPDERLEDFIVKWPGRWPKGSRGSAKPSDTVAGAGAVKPVAKAAAAPAARPVIAAVKERVRRVLKG